jgi:hypothetical protein
VKIRIYKTIILPVVMYGCESSLTLRENCRLRSFESRMQRSIFGQEKDDVAGVGGGW